MELTDSLYGRGFGVEVCRSHVTVLLVRQLLLCVYFYEEVVEHFVALIRTSS